MRGLAAALWPPSMLCASAPAFVPTSPPGVWEHVEAYTPMPFWPPPGCWSHRAERSISQQRRPASKWCTAVKSMARKPQSKDKCVGELDKEVADADESEKDDQADYASIMAVAGAGLGIFLPADVPTDVWQERERHRRKSVSAIQKTAEYKEAHRRFDAGFITELPATPDAGDHTLSKRTWENKVQNWRWSLKRLADSDVKKKKKKESEDTVEVFPGKAMPPKGKGKTRHNTGGQSMKYFSP